MISRWLVRWKYRYIVFMHGDEMMKRRVAVENYLAECAAGKRPLPDAKQCRELALRLGTPK